MRANKDDDDDEKAVVTSSYGLPSPAYEDAIIPSLSRSSATSVSCLQRNLSSRQIQMIAIGGSIGTALFVSIGFGLIAGGPGSLLLAFMIYSVFLATINSCLAEMTVYMPVEGSWIRMGTKWVDESFGFMLG